MAVNVKRSTPFMGYTISSLLGITVVNTSTIYRSDRQHSRHLAEADAILNPRTCIRHLNSSMFRSNHNYRRLRGGLGAACPEICGGGGLPRHGHAAETISAI